MTIDLGTLGAKVNLNTMDFNRGIQDVKKGFQRIGTDADKSAKRINLSFDKMARMATKASIAMAAVGAAGAAMAREFDKGARLMDQRRVFEGLAANIGRQSDEMIAELKRATKGALSEVNAMATATQAIMSGMEFDHVTTAMEYLQRYAKATDKSFQQLTTTIMTGLARGSVLMLDDAGIILDQASLIAEAEKKIGHALTEVEKKQVLVNAAIDQMRQKLPALGGDAETVADKLAAMKTGLTDFRNAMSIKAFTVGMDGLKWITQRFYDMVLVMADVRIGAEIMKNGFVNAIGEMVVMVNTKLMDMIIGLRNALSHSLAGLWDQNNAIANAAKAALNATVNGLDASLNVLFDVNQKFLNAEKGQNEQLARLYEARKAIMADQAKYMKLFTIPDGSDIQQGSFDLSGTVGAATSEGTTATTPMTDAVAALQDQLNRLSFEQSLIGMDQYKAKIAEARFETEQLRQRYAEMIPENPQIEVMLQQIEQLKVGTIEAAEAFEQSKGKLRNFGMEMQSTMHMFTQPLANSFMDLAETGKLSIKKLAASMVDMLNVVAAEKVARFTMEGIYHTIMAFVDWYNSGFHLQAAAQAYGGAAIMGSFVAGSALAGMAHDGISSVPEDGTWLLQKNERVVDADTNKDLKEYLKVGGKGATVHQTVNINGGDENSVLKAIPLMKEAAKEAVNESLLGRGRIYKSIKIMQPA